MNPFDQNEIYYDDDTHLYFVKESGATLISASTIVKKYANPFDPDGSILKRCAERDGVKPDELDKKWKQAGADARVKGNSIHYSFEQYILTGQVVDDNNKDIIQDYAERLKPEGQLFPEITLYDLQNGIAGRTDLVELWMDNIVNVYDFKTNKKINKYSFGKWMFPPLSHLPDSTFTHYECQLSLYALMLEARGFIPRKLTLLWINPATRRVEPMEVQYRREDMINMLKHYKKGKGL